MSTQTTQLASFVIAALPMYDFAALHSATDALWAAIRDALRARGIDAPEALTRGGDLAAQWRDTRLLFGQTCGFPYWKRLRGSAEILATPLYDFDGCDGPHHCSFLVARADDARDLRDFRGARAAVNAYDSNTGMNLFRAAVAPLARAAPFFSQVVETGAHAQSLRAVAEGRADLASVDCVSYALIAPSDLRIVARTPSTPALPFIASRAQPEPTRAALRAVLAELPPQPALGFKGVAFLPETAYGRVEQLEAEAAAWGCDRLA